MQTETLLVNLLQKVIVQTKRSHLQPDDPLEMWRTPSFEEFLIKLNMGLALYDANDHFYYVSESLGRILGYAPETIYVKGPALLQQIIAPAHRALVSEAFHSCEASLRKIPYTVLWPRISLDYSIVAGTGDMKRVYQHLLPNAVVHDKKYYTLFILHDFTGFKSSALLNYRVSHFTPEDKFETLAEGRVAPPCPYQFTKGEKRLMNALAAGKRMTEIARDLSVSSETLKKHRSNILSKAGAKNMVALLEEGIRNGWLSAK